MKDRWPDRRADPQADNGPRNAFAEVVSSRLAGTMTIDFEERRRQREDDPNAVRCARCGEWIFSRSTRCPKCGVNFQGEAFQFVHERLDELIVDRSHRRRKALVIIAVLLIVLLVGAVLYFSR